MKFYLAMLVLFILTIFDSLYVYCLINAKATYLIATRYPSLSCRMFYGPGGPYALFAGKDASKALAKMSFEDKDLTGDISDLGPFEIDALQDWEYKFMSKYVKVGTIKKTVPVTEGSSTGEPAEATDREVEKLAENGPSKNTANGTTESTSGADADQE